MEKFEKGKSYQTTEEVTVRLSNGWYTLQPGISLVFERVSRNNAGVIFYYHFSHPQMRVRMNPVAAETLIKC